MICTGPGWNDRRRALAKDLREHGFEVWTKHSDKKGYGRRRKWAICRRVGERALRMDMVEEERALRIVHRYIPDAELHGRNRYNVIVVWKEETVA